MCFDFSVRRIGLCQPLSADMARFELLLRMTDRPGNWPPFDDFGGIRIAVVTAEGGCASAC